MIELNYDDSKWQEVVSKPNNTLQIFITNRCNLNCKDCFYKEKLGKTEMSLGEYIHIVKENLQNAREITLLGGEPTMHMELPKMVNFNNSLGLKTIIYTNGFNIDTLRNLDLSNTSIRIDPKNNLKIPLKFNDRMMLVFMLRKSNQNYLEEAASFSEANGCKKFFISSIRDIQVSGDYWNDTEDTVSMEEYAEIVQNFVNRYEGNMEIHIARRGILTTKNSSLVVVDKCRFGNIFPDGTKIICPFDISKNLISKELSFNQRKCNKNHECLLRKIVLKRRVIL